MLDWLTYRPTDFLMFSVDAWLAIAIDYNIDIWPLQLIGLTAFFVVMLLWSKFKLVPGVGRIVSGVLAAAWIFVGVIYHRFYFSEINWAATYAMWLWGLQGVLLGVGGVGLGGLQPGGLLSPLRIVGLSIAMLGGLAAPTVLFSMDLGAVSLFGWGTFSTALVTVGIILSGKISLVALALLPLPTVWVLLEAVQLYSLWVD